MRWVLAGLFFLLSVGSFTSGALCNTPAYLHDIAINLGASFLEICLGIIVVNIFLEGRDKQRAIAALSTIVSNPADQFLDRVEADAINAFGRPTFVVTLEDFRSDIGSRHSALSLMVCKKVANIYISARADYDKALDQIASALKELRGILGWSFDPKVLESLSAAGEAMDLLKGIRALASDEDHRDACKYFLDVYLAISDVKARLTRRSG
jgi:hypothetical protein